MRALLLNTKAKFSPDGVWYKTTPVGEDELGKMMGNMAQGSGLEGTPHKSLSKKNNVH